MFIQSLQLTQSYMQYKWFINMIYLSLGNNMYNIHIYAIKFIFCNVLLIIKFSYKFL